MRTLLFIIYLIIHCNAVAAQSIKIPIDTARWYQVNFTSGSVAKLFDGDKNTVPFTGWSKILSNYDAYYPLKEGEQMSIDSIRIYDKEGVFTSAPLTVYAITDNWERKLVATFTGELYNVWVGPYPSRNKVFKLDTAINHIRYLMMNITNNNFPGEIELYGTYTSGSEIILPPNPARVPLKNMFGINGFAWNFQDPDRTMNINEDKMNTMKSFRGFRQYIDWEKLEEVEGRYYFSPQARGGWHLDTIYKRCQEEGIEVLATLQNIPPWMVATYPDSLKAIDNNPVRYGKSFSDPASYIEQAKLGFQFAARYGNNRNIDSSLVSVYSVPAWPNQPVNKLMIGMGLIRYIECGNEVDKFWRGRNGYLSGREYAANLSAFYDGNKNTMGSGVGVKNADPQMQVVMSGIASCSPDYFREIIDWCKEFRGYNSDGTVNLCFDIINYHLYSNDAGSSQSGGSTRGAAPEVSNCATMAKTFIKAAHLYARDMPVWVTEQGYDVNQQSVYKAIPVGNRSVLETQADWTLRSALLYAREGLQKSFFYVTYDADTNSGKKFASMGLINKTNLTRKPAADFLYQTNKLFGNYSYQETINADPVVDRYEWNGQSMYVLLVPDEKGRTADYTLPLHADSVMVYTPVVASDNMTAAKVNTSNGTLQLTVTETPVFVVPFKRPGQLSTDTTVIIEAASQATKAQALTTGSRPNTENGEAVSNAGVYDFNIHNYEKALLNKDVIIFPNPTTSKLFIENKRERKLKLVLMNIQGSKITELSLFTRKGTVKLNKLTPGMYVLAVSDINTKETGGKLFTKL